MKRRATDWEKTDVRYVSDKQLVFKINCCLVAQSCWILLRPHGLQPTRLLCPWDFPGKDTGVGLSFLSPRDLPDPGIEPTVEAPCSGSTES